MAKDRSTKPVLCYCHDCAHSKIFQFEYDPVITECDNGWRNVASAPVMCARHKVLEKIRCIENLPKKIGIWIYSRSLYENNTVQIRSQSSTLTTKNGGFTVTFGPTKASCHRWLHWNREARPTSKMMILLRRNQSSTLISVNLCIGGIATMVERS